MTLTPQQLAFFDTFGFLKFPGLLADSIDWIIAEFELVFPNYPMVTPHDGSKRTCIVPFIDQRERLCTLIDDPRIEGICAGLCGPDFNYMASDGNYYTGDTAWHPDGHHHRYRHIKIALYLDPLTRDTGALRVISGSHRIADSYAEKIREHVPRSVESLGIAGPEIPAVALEVTPGDVLAFNHNTFYSAWGGNTRRRMFTINICERYAKDDEPELRQYLAGLARFWLDRAYGDAMTRTADPARMRHLEQVLANDYELAALSAKARQEMAEPSRS